MSARNPGWLTSFSVNENHFPIQDFYSREVVRDGEGGFTMTTLGP